jgi:hypothetical protein
MFAKNQLRKSGRLALGLLVIALLAVTAFVGVRLVRSGDLGLETLFGRSVRMIPSDQLPSPEPDISGIFISRENNSILIGTGNVKWETYRENDLATPVFTKSYDGPVVELVINHETVIYCNAQLSPDEIPSSGTVQQRVEQVPEATIGEDQDQLLWAWGQREGDRFLAQTVLIYTRPYGEGCES